jgi:hypothetical protein|nr:MAG TPA: hypothetical protein [Caudoviricetes sp.]
MALETIDQALARREQPKQENVIEIPADDEPAEVNVQPKSREEFLNAIYLAHSNILRAKLKLRTAKENREDLVGDLEEKQDLDELRSRFARLATSWRLPFRKAQPFAPPTKSWRPQSLISA